MKKKNKQVRASKRSSPLLSFAIVAFLIIGAIVLTNVNWSQDKKTSSGYSLSPDPSKDVQEKYDELVKKISPTNVCPNLHPVHIFREVNGKMLLDATGAQLDGDGSILTCGHAFWDIPGDGKVPWKFYYQVLEPYERAFHPINRIAVIGKVDTNSVNASHDVMVCIPGPAELIAPLPPPPEVQLQEGKMQQTFDGFDLFKQPEIVRSTVTGESVALIGSMQLVGGPAYFVLDCNTFQTQSGTIYASADNKKVYILSMSVMTTPEIRKTYHLDETHVGITLCSSVNLYQ